jgi:hypothetical protein
MGNNSKLRQRSTPAPVVSETPAVEPVQFEENQDIPTNQVEPGGYSPAYLAIDFFMKGDKEILDKWFAALDGSEDKPVYDVFSEEALAYTEIEFRSEAGESETIAQAVAWMIEHNPAETIAKIEEATAILKEGEDDADAKGGDDVVAVEPAIGEGAAGVEEAPSEPAFDYAAFGIEHGIPSHWTNADVDSWVASGGPIDGKTERGSFIVDPTRQSGNGRGTGLINQPADGRAIVSWQADELLDGIEDRLDGIDESHYGAIVKAYRQLVPISAAWSARELIDNLKQGIVPAKTTNGAWKNDVTRTQRPAKDWTTQELEAWAVGEIRAGGQATDVTVAMEFNTRLNLGVQSNDPQAIIRSWKNSQNATGVKLVGEPQTAEPAPVNTLAQATPVVAASTIPDGLTAMNVSYIDGQLKRYYDACKPGQPCSPEKGAVEQRQLDNLFRYILKLEDPKGFMLAMAKVRDFVGANRAGLFEGTYIYRFTGSLKLENNIQDTHITLLQLFVVHTDPSGLSKKQCDVPSELRKFPHDRQNWLLEFFQKYC